MRLECLVVSSKILTFAALINKMLSMKKNILIPLVVVILVLLGGMGYLFISLQQQKQANKDMQELAELDKQEMENEYERFTLQYSEMKTKINNDSIIAQLTEEQLKTQQLLWHRERLEVLEPLCVREAMKTIIEDMRKNYSDF